MNADSRNFKFTDELERDLIRQEAAQLGDSGRQDTGLEQALEPLLKWILAVSMAIGSVFIIVQGNL